MLGRIESAGGYSRADGKHSSAFAVDPSFRQAKRKNHEISIKEKRPHHFEVMSPMRAHGFGRPQAVGLNGRSQCIIITAAPFPNVRTFGAFAEGFLCKLQHLSRGVYVTVSG